MATKDFKLVQTDGLYELNFAYMIPSAKLADASRGFLNFFLEVLLEAEIWIKNYQFLLVFETLI